MEGRRTSLGLCCAVFAAVLAGPAAAQRATTAPQPEDKIQSPQVEARKGVTFDEMVDLAIVREQRLAELMRYFKPVVETYVQEEKHDSAVQTSPKDDAYFLSRLDLTGNGIASREFETPEHSKKGEEKTTSKIGKAFDPEDFTEALFPDLNHFDRRNYNFSFVRWELLGEVRCVAVDVTPRENSSNRGFMGRVWIEDQDYNIVRFTGTHSSKAYGKHSFHFDSWRLNTLGIRWMPAYTYTQESNPHDASSHGLWFKAQTRIWGYDLQQAGDLREYDKPLMDNLAGVDPKRHEASQDLSPQLSVGHTASTREEDVVERLQLAGLVAPDGEVDHILETVANNLLITNNLDTAGVHCRVLLTTPFESFVLGRTIVISRGLLDVLPDEATLAAVLAHELAHIVLQHSLPAEYWSQFSLPFSDLEIFAKLDYRFDPAEEAQADKKGQELFAKSPYSDKVANVALFLQALQARASELPNLLHGRFTNDFESSHLSGMQMLANAPKRLRMSQTDQIAGLPLGSRIKVDPWSDRIEMQKAKSPLPASAAEKRPFEVSPFFPNLKRLDQQKPQAPVDRN